ncbi:MAG: N-acetyltransferase [Gemmatimonadaceae bacterium]
MSLEVLPVERDRELSAFIDVPWRIPEVARHPKWVPPLRMMVRDLLDTKGNPFYRAASRQLFLARRNGRIVGRIAAIENRAHNEFHGDRVGFFGFFESIEDPEVAAALLGAARRWLRDRGLTSIRGPMNPSTNHDCGLLVDGFDEHPLFLTSWNPAYYESLIRSTGFSVAKDLVGYWLPYGESGYTMPARLEALARRAAEKANLSFRDLEPNRFWKEVELCWEIYNSAWERNWGFVPMTRDEFLYMAKSLKPVLIPQFAFLAEVKGEPAGFMLAAPDFNQIFKRVRNGRLLPLGFARVLFGKSRLRTGRVIALGIKSQFRSGSVLPVFLHESVRRAIAYGSPGAEASWILEDNLAMRQPLESFGGRVYRRWRIFERDVA